MTSLDVLAAERIDDLADPRVENYRAMRERDLAAERNAFVVEGSFALGVMVRASSFALRSVFVCDKRLPGLAPLLAGVTAPIYTASLETLHGVVGFAQHRGVLAIGDRGTSMSADDSLTGLGEGPRTVLALCGVNNHDNVGGAFRNAAALGADLVLLDDQACDPLYRKSIRVSAGGALIVPFARGGHATQVVERLARAGFDTVALTPRRFARELGEIFPELGPRVALLVGSEEPGLSEEVFASATHAARIDIEPGFDSLNVATASGIALYAARARRNARP